MLRVLAYLFSVLVAVDILINALTGGNAPDTVSARIGKSILSGGWASGVPWPQWLKQHFLDEAA